MSIYIYISIICECGKKKNADEEIEEWKYVYTIYKKAMSGSVWNKDKMKKKCVRVTVMCNVYEYNSNNNNNNIDTFKDFKIYNSYFI